MVRRTALAIVAAGVLVAAPGPAAAAVGIVRAQVSLPPDPYLFGQEVTADVDLLVDTSLVDPSLSLQGLSRRKAASHASVTGTGSPATRSGAPQASRSRAS